VPFHIVHFRARRLHTLLAEAGFDLVEARQINPRPVGGAEPDRPRLRPSGRITRALRNPLLVAGLMAGARLLAVPAALARHRRGGGDCLIAVAARR